MVEIDTLDQDCGTMQVDNTQIGQAAQGLTKVIEAGEDATHWPVYVVSIFVIMAFTYGMYLIVRDNIKAARESERAAEEYARQRAQDEISHLREQNKDLRNRK